MWGWHLSRVSGGALRGCFPGSTGEGQCGDGPSWEEGTVQGLWHPWGPPGLDWRGFLFAPRFPGTGCSGVLHRAGSCGCSNTVATGAGSKQGVALDVPGQAGLLLRTQVCLLPSSPVTSRFTLSTGRTTVVQTEASTGPAPPPWVPAGARRAPSHSAFLSQGRPRTGRGCCLPPG